MVRWLIIPNEIPVKKFDLSWKAEKGSAYLRIKVEIDCGYLSPELKERMDQVGYSAHPKNYTDKFAVKGPLTGPALEFWLPKKIWDALDEKEAEAIIDITAYLRWDEAKKGKKKERKDQTATQRFRSKAKIIKLHDQKKRVDDTEIPGITFKLEFEPITEPTLSDWFSEIGADLEDFDVLNFKFVKTIIEVSYHASGKWRTTITSDRYSDEAKELLTGKEPVTDEWYVIIGDGVYFCKTKDQDIAARAIEAYEKVYPDISWTMRLGSEEELGALPATLCEERVESLERYGEALEKGYIVLTSGPVGALMYSRSEDKFVFYDYQKNEIRDASEPDVLDLLTCKLNIENPEALMKDVRTVCRVCEEYKLVAGLTDEEINEMAKAAANGQVLPITETEFAIVSTGLYGLTRLAVSKLVQAGAVTTIDLTYSAGTGKSAGISMLESAAGALSAAGIAGAWGSISKILGAAKDIFFAALWIGGFAPFICEEAAQAIGMSIFMARQIRDPDLLKDAIDRYEQIVTTGKEITEKFGWMNPFTYDAFKLFFQAAMDSLEIYKKLPDKIKEENEEREKEKEDWAKYREERRQFHEDFMKYWEERKKSWEDFMKYWEERQRSWEAFMERDVEKTLSIMINTVTDSLRAIYFGMRTGVETISLLKRLLRQITEETTRARIEKMIEEAQNRIRDISADYEEIVQRGLEYASQVQDETARKSYEAYILTLREQIEMELMRAEAEEIPILEGIFKKGYLYVMGYPRYCRIYLNGEDTGKLAPERFVLDPGKYVVKVVRETGEEWEKEVEVKEGETTEIIYYIPRKAA